jgi:putative DNA primase/helicase
MSILSSKDRGVRAGFQEALAVMLAVHGPDFLISIKLMLHDSVKGIKRFIKAVHATAQEHFESLPEWFDKRYEAFMMIGQTDGLGHAVANVQSVHAIAVDFDEEVDLDAMTGPAARPSFVNETSAGHIHAVWLLDTPIAPVEANWLMRAKVKRLGGDPACVAANHVVRLPGSVNHKRNHLVRLAESMDETPRKYSVEFLSHAFDAQLVTNFLRNAQPRLDTHLRIVASTDNQADLIRDLRSALKALDASDYRRWIKFGFALQRLGNEGFKLWQDWSKTATNFDASIMGAKWASLAASDVGNVTPASIFFEAASHGWINPGFRDSDASSHLEQLTERGLAKMIAEKLWGEFSVLRDPDKKNAPVFFRDVDGVIQRLDDIQRREAVEAQAKSIAATIKNKDKEIFIASRSGSNTALDALCNHVAEYMQKDAVRRDASSYPYLAFPNGVMNQITGVMVPAQYRPVSIWNSPVLFDAEAQAPRFHRFLNQIFDGDEEMIRFILRLLGHVILGNPVEQVIVVFIGTGGNGKSKLVNMLKAILGPYAVSMAAGAITEKSHAGASAAPELARLQFKRLAVIAEIGNKHGIDAGLVKNLTGGEDITARALYGDYVDFLPVLVPIMLTNKTPKIREDDGGLWRRLIFVEFTQSFEGAAKDGNLETKLKRELPGIYNMLLTGAQDYLANGLQPPEKVIRSTQRTRAEVDPFQEFFNECLILAEGAETPFKAITTLYEEWRASNANYRRLTSRELGEKLVAMGLEKIDRRNLIHYLGVVPRSIVS